MLQNGRGLYQWQHRPLPAQRVQPLASVAAAALGCSAWQQVMVRRAAKTTSASTDITEGSVFDISDDGSALAADGQGDQPTVTTAGDDIMELGSVWEADDPVAARHGTWIGGGITALCGSVSGRQRDECSLACGIASSTDSIWHGWCSFPAMPCRVQYILLLVHLGRVTSLGMCSHVHGPQ